MRMRVLAGVLAAAGMVASACRTSPPAGPGPASELLSGTWTGDVTESWGGRGRLRMTIEQTQLALNGVFQLDFDNATRSRSGTLSGNVDTPAIPQRMQLSSSAGFDCAPGQSPQSFVQVTWTRTGDTLKGEYAGFGCVGTITGAFEVKRE